MDINMNKHSRILVKIFILFLMAVSIESLAIVSGSTQLGNNQSLAANDIIVKPILKSDSCGEPIYPALSKRNNEEGKVGIQLWINESGNVVTAKVAVSSGFPALDDGAVAFLSRCKFEPATKNGLPTAVWYPLNHRWALADDKEEKPIVEGKYNFEDTSKSMNLMGYVRESCMNYVSSLNNSETQDNEPLGVNKLTEADVCGCAEKMVKADKYLKLLVVAPEPDVEKIMDEQKFGVYLVRKNSVIIMTCLAKSIDASIAKLDPRKK
jgi:periplasmic protein TonB